MSGAPPRLSARGGTVMTTTETLVPLSIDRWRVLQHSGAVLGLIELVTDLRGERFRARRYRWPSGTFVEVGDFWRRDDAITALRRG